jgi:hypothetical protein
MVAALSLLVAVGGVWRDVTGFTVKDVNFFGGDITLTPRDERVSHCAVFAGAADVKDDATLWIAHRRTGIDEYFLRKVSQVQDTRDWSTSVIIGVPQVPEDESEKFELYAFYLPNDTSDFLASYETRNGYSFVRRLPPDADPKLLKEVRRSNRVNPEC